MNDQQNQQAEPPAEPQSATEWARFKWDDIWNNGVIGNLNGVIGNLMDDLIIPLARRCDAADQRCSQWADIAGEHGAECDRLRAQLAAAQDNARQTREEIEALKADVAAIAENHGEWMRRAMAFEDKLAAAQAQTSDIATERNQAKVARAERDAAQAEAGRLREACQRVLDWYDRDGSVGMASSCFEDMRDTLDALKEGGE